ncbi:MAG TPA: phosphatase PAP2 family protein [Gaiellaceae bacterium]|nr:phosphatase PAP2 family protein [Gaiellaceae bacterium]
MTDRQEHDRDVVWAMDAQVGGDGTAALPRPGRLALPTRFRRPERPLTEEELQRRHLRALRWGAPLADIGRQRLALTLLVLAGALALAIALFGMSLTSDRYLLILLLPALVLRRGRVYLRDFGLFALLVFAYSELRGLAHIINAQPYYTPQLNLDKWLFAGYVPTVELQKWFWTGSMQWYDHLLIDVANLHFIVPPLFAFLLWMKRRALFFRFASSMLVLSFSAALTFVLFPTAPPWAAGHQLLTPTVTQITDHTFAAVPASFSASKLIESNPYAAIPSLHGGYAMLCFIFVATLVWNRRWRWWAIVPAAFYPLALSFARVYTGDHYVVDLLAGYVYAVAAFLVVGWYWRRHDLPA